MGTEIRTFYSLREMNESISEEIDQYRALAEDYSQWLGSLLRSCEENHGTEEWFQKSTAMQKNLRVQGKRNAEAKQPAKGKAKGKKGESSCWVQSAGILLCSTEQGEAEVLFEALEDINGKIQGLERFKAAIQQIERLGLGKNVNYVAYFKDDVPEKMVLRAKRETDNIGNFKFTTDLTAPGLYQ
jgi:hypothetical protein